MKITHQMDKITTFGITNDQDTDKTNLKKGMAILSQKAKRLMFVARENPGTRCNVLTDAGKTKATKKSPFCVYFAQGRCAMVPHITISNIS